MNTVRSRGRPLALLALLLPVSIAAQQPAPAPPPLGDAYTFVVLGHVRGGRAGPNPKLAELLDEVRRIKPAFAVLTGDMIWGDVDNNPARRDTVLREWVHLDSAMATLGVPTYRVPGNHEIQDVVTRDLYRERYGQLPQVVTLGTTRLLLLNSTHIPPDGDTAKMKFTRGKDLDSAQVAWLRAEVAKPGFAHTFAFLHHLLWWQKPEGAWWRDAHPLLVSGKVHALFSGDYGPLKFSTLTRDSVRYFQSAIEGSPSIEMLRGSEYSRMLSAQFDNFLAVRVNGPSVDVEVHTVSEVSSGAFSPAHYQAMMDGPARPAAPIWRRAMNFVGSPKRAAVLGAGVLLMFGLGWFARGVVSKR